MGGEYRGGTQDRLFGTERPRHLRAEETPSRSLDPAGSPGPAPEAAGATGQAVAAGRAPRNAFNFLRLLMALGVIFSHAFPLGGNPAAEGQLLTRGQTSYGGLCVFGFFVISGYLIVASARRLSLPRYLWHRFLRIMPGYWVALLLSAFVVGPIAYAATHGTIGGYLAGSGGPGPVSYLHGNAFLGIHQYGIDDVFSSAPFSAARHQSIINGSIWTLVYEALCYVAVAAVALVGVLRRLPGAVALIALGLWIVIVVYGTGLAGDPTALHHLVIVPVIGPLDLYWLWVFGFVFALGAVLQVFTSRHSFPVVLCVIAGTVSLLTLHFGWFERIGLFFFAYFVIGVGYRLPPLLRRIGARRDYSYGIYIYGFVVEQALATAGLYRYGYWPFALASVAGTLVFAAFSWHFVERAALSLKSWRPPMPPDVPWPRRREAPRRHPLADEPVPQAVTGPGISS